jgi:hypothetical protein
MELYGRNLLHFSVLISCYAIPHTSAVVKELSREFPAKTDTEGGDADSSQKRQEMISYLNARQKELGNYVRNFFAETFEHILR